MKYSYILIIAVLLLGGCVRDEANRYYGSTHYSEKDVSQVALLKKRPDRPFVVIADFQSRGDTAEGLRKKAAKIGADAVIVTFLGGWYDLDDKWAGQDSKSTSYNRAVGTAIKYQ
jgi:hypothetical protein